VLLKAQQMPDTMQACGLRIPRQIVLKRGPEMVRGPGYGLDPHVEYRSKKQPYYVICRRSRVFFDTPPVID